MELNAILTIYIVFFMFTLITFIWGLIILFRNWNTLPTWVKILGIIFLLSPLPVGTLIIVYITKK